MYTLDEIEGLDFFAIDDGEGLPTVASCTVDGVLGYGFLVFTSEEYAHLFRRLYVPPSEDQQVRKLVRRQVNGRMIQSDLVRAARKYKTAELPRPVLAMIIDHGSPAQQVVPLNDVVALGLKQRSHKSAQDELFNE